MTLKFDRAMMVKAMGVATDMSSAEEDLLAILPKKEKDKSLYHLKTSNYPWSEFEEDLWKLRKALLVHPSAGRDVLKELSEDYPRDVLRHPWVEDAMWSGKNVFYGSDALPGLGRCSDFPEEWEERYFLDTAGGPFYFFEEASFHNHMPLALAYAWVDRWQTGVWTMARDSRKVLDFLRANPDEGLAEEILFRGPADDAIFKEFLKGFVYRSVIDQVVTDRLLARIVSERPAALGVLAVEHTNAGPLTHAAAMAEKSWKLHVALAQKRGLALEHQKKLATSKRQAILNSLLDNPDLDPELHKQISGK
jgi:hypothetical protein